jgi:ADP-ribose pyrophosphatase
MGPQDVEITEKRNVYRGYGRVDVYRLRHRLFGGGWTPVFQRELLDRGHAAAVLPYDAAADAVVLIEQFRLGAQTAGLPPWQLECVAGIIDAGETAQAVAVRESEEEAGCTLSDVVPICRFLASPGITNETVELFCARADSAGRNGAIHGLPEEHEDIRVVVMTLSEALALIERRELMNVPALIALQWLALRKDELRRRWGEPDRPR